MTVERTKFDVSRHIAACGHGNVVDLALDDIRNVERWSGVLQGNLRARVLGALLHDSVAPDLIEATAESIVTSEQWPLLLRELLCDAEFGFSIVNVANKVLSRHLPDHPLPVHFARADYALMVYDGLADAAAITFRTPHLPEKDQLCLILDPLDIVSRCVVAKVEWKDGAAVFSRHALSWLAPTEIVCPAFAVIACSDNVRWT